MGSLKSYDRKLHRFSRLELQNSILFKTLKFLQIQYFSRFFLYVVNILVFDLYELHLNSTICESIKNSWFFFSRPIYHVQLFSIQGDEILNLTLILTDIQKFWHLFLQVLKFYLCHFDHQKTCQSSVHHTQTFEGKLLRLNILNEKKKFDFKVATKKACNLILQWYKACTFSV